MLSQKSMTHKSLLQAIGTSFYNSIGDIVFGMEDGTVPIFGLVFGVASSTNSSSVVLLAGATGAISAAVAMMAGTFLEVETTNDQTKAQLAQEQAEIAAHLEGEKQKVRDRLHAAGFNDQDTNALVEILARNPEAFLLFEATSELPTGHSEQKNPFVHSLWMFISYLFAAAVPVIPFAFLPPGDRAPRLAHHHGLALAPPWGETRSRRTAQSRAQRTRNTGYRHCCSVGRLSGWQTCHPLGEKVMKIWL